MLGFSRWTGSPNHLEAPRGIAFLWEGRDLAQPTMSRSGAIDTRLSIRSQRAFSVPAGRATVVRDIFASSLSERGKSSKSPRDATDEGRRTRS